MPIAQLPFGRQMKVSVDIDKSPLTSTLLRTTGLTQCLENTSD